GRVHASSPNGRATRAAVRAAPPLAGGQLEENLECEGVGAAVVDEVARLAEIGLRVGRQQRLRVVEAKKDELLMPPAPHLRPASKPGSFIPASSRRRPRSDRGGGVAARTRGGRARTRPRGGI